MLLEYTTFFLMEAVAAKKQKDIFFSGECRQKLIFLGDRETFSSPGSEFRNKLQI